MPTLGVFDTEKIILPSSKEGDQAWVVIKTNLTIGDVTGSEGVDKMAASFKMLANIIREWNFTDKDGQIVPITEDNIKLMEISDVLEIQKRVKLPTEVMDELKKKV
jgi:hypothetical protein